MFPFRRASGRDKQDRFVFVSYTCGTCLTEYVNALVKAHAKTVRCEECDSVHKITDSERHVQLRKT